MTTAKFKQPPLMEVSFGIEFEAPEFSSVHFGLYWETIRDEFPLQVDRQPKLESNIFSSMPPLRRVWFLSDDEKRLIQIQDNYFSYNWSQEDGEEYPHFEKIFPEFLKQWNHLRNWLSKSEEKFIETSVYELAYFNLIDERSGWVSAEDHPKIFTFFREGLESSFETPMFIDSQLAFSLPNKEGRLLVTVDQQIQEVDDSDDYGDNLEFLIFNLTARSFDTSSELESWFRIAHEYMIKAFLNLTKKEDQERWEPYED